MSEFKPSFYYKFSGISLDLRNCPRTPEKGELYPYAKEQLEEVGLCDAETSCDVGNLRKYYGLDGNWDLFNELVKYRNMTDGDLISTNDIQQSQWNWPVIMGSSIWDRIIAREPKRINILFTAPHSSETWQMRPQDEIDTYKEEKHLSEKLTYHLALKLADYLGAGVIAWNDEQRISGGPRHKNPNPGFLNIDERKESPWWWLAKSYQNSSLSNQGSKIMHIDIHQQTTSGNNELEVGFAAMDYDLRDEYENYDFSEFYEEMKGLTKNELVDDFRKAMMDKLTNVVDKYSYGCKKVLVMDAINSESRNFGGNGVPVKWDTWGRLDYRLTKYKAVFARQTQDLGYDMSVQWELTNPLFQELIGNKPFFEEFANAIKSVYEEMTK